MRDNECLVNDVTIQHGRMQRIMTTNGVLLHLIIKNGLMYFEDYYPTARQMLEIDREKFMISKNTWGPSKLDDTEGAAKRHLQQYPPTPMDSTDSFYAS